MTRRGALLGAGAALLMGGGAAIGWSRSTGSRSAYDAWAATQRAWPGVPAEVAALVGLATLAPNGHNTQPWRFRLSDGRIEVMPDLARRTPVVDPDDHHLYASLGAAAETLAIAGGALGLPGAVTPAADGLAYDYAPGQASDDPLAEAISRRQSTRAEYDGQPLAARDVAALEAAGSMPGVRLALVTARPAIERLRDLVLEGNGRQMSDPDFMAELKAWIRFNPRAAMATGDGLFSGASGNPSLPTALGNAIFSRVVTASGENERYARQMRSSAGCAVFFAEREGPEGWMQVGRACQRFALAATARDIRLAFVNQPVEVPELRAELAALAGEPGLRPDLLIRFGRGPVLPFSPRRPVAQVIV